jgi:LacI family transcriptional regulator
LENLTRKKFVFFSLIYKWLFFCNITTLWCSWFMAQPMFLSIAEQVAAYVRDEIMRGRWSGEVPGMNRLAPELGVNAKTVEAALQLLEKQGLLVPQGRGRRRRIAESEKTAEARPLRVGILLYEKADRRASYLLDLLQRLKDSGHESFYAEMTLRDLGGDVKRIARFVEGTEVDAWVVMAGSREVLDWFGGQTTPAFALFGRNTQTPLAGISLNKGEALIELTDRLVGLGHRRIVLLVREERRRPNPAHLEQLILDRLVAHGIATGPYTLPDWGDSPEELSRALDSLFEHTPPTALIIDQPSLCVAVIQHFSRLGISCPDQVSLACTDTSESFEWCVPAIAHIDWDSRPVINRVVRWASHISRGMDDLRKSSSKVRLVFWGTIGPAPKKR